MFFSSELIQYILHLKTLKTVVNLVLAVVIAALIMIVANQLVKHFIRGIVKKTQKNSVKKQLNTFQAIVLSIINVTLAFLTLFSVMDILGFDIRPFLTAAGIVGVAIGLGSKALVEDIISGLSLLFSGQLMVGDYVQIGESVGVVEKLNIKMVLIRDIQGGLHYIRNGSIDKVINFTRGFSYALFELGVGYSENIPHVIDVLKELSSEIRNKPEFKKKIISDVEIFGIDKFDESSIVLKFRIKTMPSYQLEVYWAFNLMIKEKFDELGIEIPFNQIVVHTEK